jgi:transcriptional regulator with XRE-family HTH domain
MTSPLRIFNGLGPALRLLRETVGLKQAQVAERTGIAQNRLSRYENERKLPDLRTLDRLLVCYGVDAGGSCRRSRRFEGSR